jgi:hypothetical protein
MSSKIENELVLSTKLPQIKATESFVTQETSNNSNPTPYNKKDAIILPPNSCSPKPKADFNAIYDILHGKFPEIINTDKPALLAVGIRKEMSQETGVSSVVLKRWIAWYCRKSNYYTNHKQGAIRFHLDGREAGIVTEGHQEKMEKRLERAKVCNMPPPLDEDNKDIDNSLSATIITDVK